MVRILEKGIPVEMDVHDRLVPEDLMANSVILATFVYHAAVRDEQLPRTAQRPW